MGFDESFTYYLFARPTFLEGVARTLDITGAFDSYNESSDGKAADARALTNDWKMVGFDIQTGLDGYGKEIKGKEASKRETDAYARTAS